MFFAFLSFPMRVQILMWTLFYKRNQFLVRPAVFCKTINTFLASCKIGITHLLLGHYILQRIWSELRELLLVNVLKLNDYEETITATSGDREGNSTRIHRSHKQTGEPPSYRRGIYVDYDGWYSIKNCSTSHRGMALRCCILSLPCHTSSPFYRVFFTKKKLIKFQY
jgi:hypothetical protein